jgi:hypothetical protein
MIHLLIITKMTRKILIAVVLMATFFTTSSFATGTEQPHTLGWRQWAPTTILRRDTTRIKPSPVNFSVIPDFGSGFTFNNANYRFRLGYQLRVRSSIAWSGAIGYSQESFNDDALKSDFVYNRLTVPFLISYAPSALIHIGVGAEYEYLLNAKINSRPITLSNNANFERHGVGILADANFGWSNKSPRLGVRYTYKIGASQKGHDYGFSEVYLRIPIVISQ